MSDPDRCPQCGAELSADALGGLCPKCLLAAGLGSGAEVGQAAGSGSDTPTTPHSGSFVPPDAAWLAAHFPQLEILELLGHGGMGAVYKARQPRLDRLVALKIIRPEAADDPAFAERFNREARMLARLSHPHIVAVYDFGEVNVSEGASGEPPRKLYYFLMEYVDGTNLRQLLQTGELLPEQALAIVPQICEALQFAHDEGVVHRDIKPENILLDKRGRVKIADFGLAKLAAVSPQEFTLTGTHQVMGTPRYMAPEQMEGSHAVDHRADIYSLGVVFYEMLTGEVPAGHFEPPSKKVEIDVRLDEVVLRSLAREPYRRYQQASEVKTDVESISGHGRTEQDVSSDAEQVEKNEAKEHVQGPGVLMFLIGIFATTYLFHDGGDEIRNLLRGDIGATQAIAIWRLGGPILLVGGIAMQGLRWYWLAIAASVHCLLAFPVTLITGSVGSLWIPFALGVYSLWQLTLPEVREAFRQRTKRNSSQTDEPELRNQQASDVKTAVVPISQSPETRANAPSGVVESAPRFSRKAVLGACAVALSIAASIIVLVTGAIVFDLYITRRRADAHGGPPVQWWEYPILFTLGIAFLSGLIAPFAATLLGIVAMREINDSKGRLVGFGLAFFDAVFCPVLLISLVILAVCFIPAAYFARFAGMDEEAASILLPLLLVALPVDILLLRWWWRAAVKDRQRIGSGTERERQYLHASEVKSEVKKMTTPGSPDSVSKGDVESSGREDTAAAAEVRAPATALTAVGVFEWLACWTAAGIAGLAFRDQMVTVMGSEDAMGALLLTVIFLGAILSALVILAGLKMRRLESWAFCLFGSVVAMLISPGNVIGLPIGVWSLFVLTRPEVKAAFASRKTRLTANRSAASGPSTGRAAGVPPSASHPVVESASILPLLRFWITPQPPSWVRWVSIPGLALLGLWMLGGVVLMAAVQNEDVTAGWLVLGFVGLPIAFLILHVVWAFHGRGQGPGSDPWESPQAERDPEAVKAPLVTRRSKEPAAVASPRPRGTLGQAWDAWWAERDRWLTWTVLAVLLGVHIACLAMFLALRGGGGYDSGLASAWHHVGWPTPWFVYELGVEPNVAFRRTINLLSWSILIAGIGMLAWYAFWRIQLVRDARNLRFWQTIGSPTAVLIIWILAGAAFAWLGVRSADRLYQSMRAQDSPVVSQAGAERPDS